MMLCNTCDKEVSSYSDLFTHQANCNKIENIPTIEEPVIAENPEQVMLSEMANCIFTIGSKYTVYGHDHYNPRYKEKTVMNTDHSSFSNDILTTTDDSELIYPVTRGCINDWEEITVFISEMLKRGFFNLEKNTIFVLVIPSFWSVAEATKYVDLFFSIGAGAVCPIYSSVGISTFYCTQKNDILLDINNYESYTCFVENEIQSKIHKIDIGFTDVINKFNELTSSNITDRDSYSELSTLLFNENQSNQSGFHQCFDILFPHGNNFKAHWNSRGKKTDIKCLLELVCNQIEFIVKEQTNITIHISGWFKSFSSFSNRLQQELQVIHPNHNFTIKSQPGLNESWLGAQIRYTSCMTHKNFILHCNYEMGDQTMVMEHLEGNKTKN